MNHSTLTTRAALRLAAPASLALMTMFAASCHSVGDQADTLAAADSSPEAADTATLEITFKEQDARLLSNRMRGFQLSDLQVRIEAPDSQTWIVSGPASDVRAIRSLAMALDRTILTPEHVVRTYDIEHHDGRLLVNSSRGTAPEGANWGIVVNPDGRWYVIVKQDEVGAFEDWLDEIDSPN